MIPTSNISWFECWTDLELDPIEVRFEDHRARLERRRLLSLPQRQNLQRVAERSGLQIKEQHHRKQKTRLIKHQANRSQGFTFLTRMNVGY